MSKVIERIVNHLTGNQLFSPFQSAYCKFHSTKTVLFSLHGYLINAIGHHQQVSCRCLLDLSAAFDTLTLWLSWIAYLYRLEFKSYFSDRLFCVKCWRDLSEPYQSCYVVPQSPLLRPLLFTLCTTPLSSLISSLSLNHHLYADLTYTCCVTSRTLLLPPPGIHPSSQWVMMGGCQTADDSDSLLPRIRENIYRREAKLARVPASSACRLFWKFQGFKLRFYCLIYSRCFRN